MDRLSSMTRSRRRDIDYVPSRRIDRNPYSVAAARHGLISDMRICEGVLVRPTSRAVPPLFWTHGGARSAESPRLLGPDVNRTVGSELVAYHVRAYRDSVVRLERRAFVEDEAPTPVTHVRLARENPSAGCAPSDTFQRSAAGHRRGA
jgi:hypothetical protein